MVLGQLDIHMQENKAGHLPYIIDKNYLKTDHISKCKSQNYTTL